MEHTKLRHLIDPLDFSAEEIIHLLDLADDIASSPKSYYGAPEL